MCNLEITFSDWHVSPTGKKIPLDAITESPHRCSIWKQQHRRYYPCRNDCGAEIYFDDSLKSRNGKWVPIDRETGDPHRCSESYDY
jgi:hypothetical protein